MQRSECRTPSWLGGYAEQRSGNLSYLRYLRAIEPLITHCQHKNSLHPSRRMAWKIFRHGEARNFPSPRKKTRQSWTNKHVPIKFYKISKNISVFILLLQNKALSLQCCSGQQNKQPLAVSHWPLAKQQNTNQKLNIKHNAQIKSAQRQI